MTRTKIAFLVAGAFALTLTVKEANSASFNATYGCHTNCRWGWYHAGNGKNYIGCHRNTWSCAFASPCNPKACRWWHWWH
jgi:hypothetical protein